ncbi:hypothetical protein [Bradyrhizobium sp. USDA 4516]
MAAPVIDRSLERLESTAQGCARLVLVQPTFQHGDPTELFAQASQARMPARLIPSLVQPTGSDVLKEWGRSGTIGLAPTLDDPDPLTETLETALQLGFHLEVSGGVEGRERLAELLWPTAIVLCSGISDSRAAPAIQSGIRVWTGFWHSLKAPRYG